LEGAAFPSRQIGKQHVSRWLVENGLATAAGWSILAHTGAMAKKEGKGRMETIATWRRW
jgi:hypothetical protein